MQPLLLQLGNTPLMLAARSRSRLEALDFEVAELLLSRGADKSKRNNAGSTALQLAPKGYGSAEAKAALAALLA